MLRFLVCVVFFHRREIENENIYEIDGPESRQSNSLQNDVCFSQIGQKLWEKMRF